MMKLEQLRILEDVQAFLEGTQAVVFEVAQTKTVRCRWIERILIRFSYSKLSKKQRGSAIRLLMKVSGYSRQQVTRSTSATEPMVGSVAVVSAAFDLPDAIGSRALRCWWKPDRLHDVPNGLAVKRIFERAWTEYGDGRFVHFSGILVSHIYNLRKSLSYQCQRTWREKTRTWQIDIGVRRCSQPDGKSGILDQTVYTNVFGYTLCCS